MAVRSLGTNVDLPVAPVKAPTKPADVQSQPEVSDAQVARVSEATRIPAFEPEPAVTNSIGIPPSAEVLQHAAAMQASASTQRLNAEVLAERLSTEPAFARRFEMYHQLEERRGALEQELASETQSLEAWRKQHGGFDSMLRLGAAVATPLNLFKGQFPTFAEFKRRLTDPEMLGKAPQRGRLEALTHKLECIDLAMSNLASELPLAGGKAEELGEEFFKADFILQEMALLEASGKTAVDGSWQVSGRLGLLEQAAAAKDRAGVQDAYMGAVTAYVQLPNATGESVSAHEDGSPTIAAFVNQVITGGVISNRGGWAVTSDDLIKLLPQLKRNWKLISRLSPDVGPTFPADLFQAEVLRLQTLERGEPHASLLANTSLRTAGTTFSSIVDPRDVPTFLKRAAKSFAHLFDAPETYAMIGIGMLTGGKASKALLRGNATGAGELASAIAGKNVTAKLLGKYAATAMIEGAVFHTGMNAFNLVRGKRERADWSAQAFARSGVVSALAGAAGARHGARMQALAGRLEDGASLGFGRTLAMKGWYFGEELAANSATAVAESYLRNGDLSQAGEILNGNLQFMLAMRMLHGTPELARRVKSSERFAKMMRRLRREDPLDGSLLEQDLLIQNALAEKFATASEEGDQRINLNAIFEEAGKFGEKLIAGDKELLTALNESLPGKRQGKKLAEVVRTVAEAKERLEKLSSSGKKGRKERMALREQLSEARKIVQGFIERSAADPGSEVPADLRRFEKFLSRVEEAGRSDPKTVFKKVGDQLGLSPKRVIKIFAEELNISEQQVLEALGTSVGLDPNKVLDATLRENLGTLERLDLGALPDAVAKGVEGLDAQGFRLRDVLRGETVDALRPEVEDGIGALASAARSGSGRKPAQGTEGLNAVGRALERLGEASGSEIDRVGQVLESAISETGVAPRKLRELAAAAPALLPEKVSAFLGAESLIHLAGTIGGIEEVLSSDGKRDTLTARIEQKFEAFDRGMRDLGEVFEVRRLKAEAKALKQQIASDPPDVADLRERLGEIRETLRHRDRLEPFNTRGMTRLTEALKGLGFDASTIAELAAPLRTYAMIARATAHVEAHNLRAVLGEMPPKHRDQVIREVSKFTGNVMGLLVTPTQGSKAGRILETFGETMREMQSASTPEGRSAAAKSFVDGLFGKKLATKLRNGELSPQERNRQLLARVQHLGATWVEGAPMNFNLTGDPQYQALRANLHAKLKELTPQSGQSALEQTLLQVDGLTGMVGTAANLMKTLNHPPKGEAAQIEAFRRALEGMGLGNLKILQSIGNVMLADMTPESILLQKDVADFIDGVEFGDASGKRKGLLERVAANQSKDGKKLAKTLRSFFKAVIEVQDNVSPMSAETVREMIELSLPQGKKLEDYFEWIGEPGKLALDKPLAQGTIGQTYRVRLKGMKRDSALKVVRKGIGHELKRSLAATEGLLDIASEFYKIAGDSGIEVADKPQVMRLLQALVPPAVEQFGMEIDMPGEATNIRYMEKLLEADPYAVVPKVDAVTKTFLLLEFMPGDSVPKWIKRFQVAAMGRERAERGFIATGEVKSAKEALKRARVAAETLYGFEKTKGDPVIVEEKSNDKAYCVRMEFDSGATPFGEVMVEKASGKVTGIGVIPDLSPEAEAALLSRNFMSYWSSFGLDQAGHGDPHFGNGFVLADGKTEVVLDLGNMIRARSQFAALVELSMGVGYKNPDLMADAFMRAMKTTGMSDQDKSNTRDYLKSTFSKLVADNKDIKLEEWTEKAMKEVLATAGDVKLSGNFVQMIRSAATQIFGFRGLKKAHLGSPARLMLDNLRERPDIVAEQAIMACDEALKWDPEKREAKLAELKDVFLEHEKARRRAVVKGQDAVKATPKQVRSDIGAALRDLGLALPEASIESAVSEVVTERASASGPWGEDRAIIRALERQFEGSDSPLDWTQEAQMSRVLGERLSQRIETHAELLRDSQKGRAREITEVLKANGLTLPESLLEDTIREQKRLEERSSATWDAFKFQKNPVKMIRDPLEARKKFEAENPTIIENYVAKSSIPDGAEILLTRAAGKISPFSAAVNRWVKDAYVRAVIEQVRPSDATASGPMPAHVRALLGGRDIPGFQPDVAEVASHFGGPVIPLSPLAQLTREEKDAERERRRVVKGQKRADEESGPKVLGSVAAGVGAAQVIRSSLMDRTLAIAQQGVAGGALPQAQAALLSGAFSAAGAMAAGSSLSALWTGLKDLKAVSRGELTAGEAWRHTGRETGFSLASAGAAGVVGSVVGNLVRSSGNALVAPAATLAAGTAASLGTQLVLRAVTGHRGKKSTESGADPSPLEERGAASLPIGEADSGAVTAVDAPSPKEPVVQWS